MCGIYRIVNKVNNKIYVGQSIAIEKRLNKHKSSAYNLNDKSYEYPLYRAIRKYGIDNFSFELLEECEVYELNEKERFWICFYHSDDSSYGYNQTSGGDSSLNLKITWSIADEIISLLINTNLSQQEIANQFGVTQVMVSYICNGISWRKVGVSYPIREKNSQNGKNKSQETKKCIDCGKPITGKSIRCSSCSGKISRVTDRPVREELKYLIRNKSFTEIGRMFSVSDNAIKKWCDSYSLPRTKREIKTYSDEDWGNI